MVIKLHNLINELYAHIHTKREYTDVLSKCMEVKDECQNLLGNQDNPEVVERLKNIMDEAVAFGEDLDKRREVNYNVAKASINVMFDNIKEIGKILNVEFDEETRGHL